MEKCCIQSGGINRNILGPAEIIREIRPCNCRSVACFVDIQNIKRLTIDLYDRGLVVTALDLEACSTAGSGSGIRSPERVGNVFEAATIVASAAVDEIRLLFFAAAETW